MTAMDEGQRMDAFLRRRHTDQVTGDWMLTYTGRKVYPLNVQPGDVDPVDIAHALSLLCRFNGHVSRFYSVAEHSVLMSRAVPEEWALWALLHDATEAYVGDMIRPLKRYMPDYVEAENDVMFAICERFGLPRDDIFSVDLPAPVKDADNRILLTERDELLAPSPEPWIKALEDLEPLDVQIAGWYPPVAEQMFLLRLRQLGVAV